MSLHPVTSDSVVYYSGRASGLNLIGRLLRILLFVVLCLVVFALADEARRLAAHSWLHGLELQSRDAQQLLDQVRAYLPSAERLQLSETTENNMRLGSASLAAIGLVCALVALLRWGRVRYVITNDRIQFERGILSRTIKSIELWRMRDLIFHRTTLEGLFGMGRIMIVSRDPTAVTSVVGPIHRARDVYNKLLTAREAAVRDRGVVAVES